jgi:hypothetical protein
MQYCFNITGQSATLSQRTSLPVEDIIKPLAFCHNRLGQLLYQQVSGTAMGSPVSPVIANLVMEDVEQRALVASVPVSIPFWRHFVDDVVSAVCRNGYSMY